MLKNTSYFSKFMLLKRRQSPFNSSILQPLASFSSVRGNGGHNYNPFSSPIEKDVWKLPRVYLDQELIVGSLVECDRAVSHYVSRVMRLREGQSFRAFNCSIRHSDNEGEGHSAPGSLISSTNSQANRFRERRPRERPHAGEFLLVMPGSSLTLTEKPSSSCKAFTMLSMSKSLCFGRSNT
jgi:hypothetical protein